MSTEALTRWDALSELEALKPRVDELSRRTAAFGELEGLVAVVGHQGRQIEELGHACNALREGPQYAEKAWAERRLSELRESLDDGLGRLQASDQSAAIVGREDAVDSGLTTVSKEPDQSAALMGRMEAVESGHVVSVFGSGRRWQTPCDWG